MPLAVCATPIGNLEDVTLRVLRELAEADVVLCEDTRHTRKLLERHGIKARLLSYHRHNEAQRTGRLLPRLQAGERIALVSDSGLPAISDPGARLVAAALEAGVPVTVLPGPSAVETALVAGGRRVWGGSGGGGWLCFRPRWVGGGGGGGGGRPRPRGWPRRGGGAGGRGRGCPGCRGPPGTASIAAPCNLI